MNSTNLDIVTVPFPEINAVPKAESNNINYDIIFDGNCTLIDYCSLLLNRVFELKQSQFPAFLNYQINQNKESECWLNKFEKLLASNEILFSSRNAISRFTKMYNLTNDKRKELQSSSIKEPIIKTPKRLINAESEERYFSFTEVKSYIESIESFGEKIIYLSGEVFDYKQADIISINNKLQSYDAQCTQLMEKLQTMRKMRIELDLEKNIKLTSQILPNKLQFNGNLNQLVDIFYQLHRELFVEGKPYLDGNTNDLVLLIVNSFVDKEGKDISPLTVKTILKPSKEEKRPNTQKRIDIDKLL